MSTGVPSSLISNNQLTLTAFFFAEIVNYPEQHLVCTKLKGLFVGVLGVLANDVWGKIISLFV